MLKQETRTIDGLEITAVQLVPTKAIYLQARLLKLLGPALAKGNLFRQVAVGGEEAQSAVIAALAEVAASVNVDEAMSLITEICKMAKIGGQYIRDPDNELEDAMTVYKVVAFVIEVNFRSFFKGREL